MIRQSSRLLELTLVLLSAGCGASPKEPDAPTSLESQASWSPPGIPANFAVRPIFRLRDGQTISAGTAFAASMDGAPPVLISAMHLFGEAGGLQRDLPASTLPESVQSVTLYDMDYGRRVASAGKELIRDGKAMDFKSTDCSPDVVAFTLQSHVPLGSLPLAKQNPSMGIRVWAVGREYSDKGSSAKLYAGTVVESNDSHITVKEAVPFEGRGFSGGPVINARSEVVGTYLASGKTNFGNTFAYLNPVSSIRRHLARVASAGR
jgi:hypothetical protein